MLSSTRLLDPSRLGIYRQGNGLVQTGAAWNLLATNISTDEIVARVPVNTVLSQFLAQPGIGVGIHDREGVTTGQSYTRTYTITRTKGGSQPKTYAVTWVGNDGNARTDSHDVPDSRDSLRLLVIDASNFATEYRTTHDACDQHVRTLDVDAESGRAIDL